MVPVSSFSKVLYSYDGRQFSSIVSTELCRPADVERLARKVVMEES